MTEIYANGRLLELGNVKITKVFQINDIGEPKDRQLDYTLPFDIPDTPNNLITLEMLGVVGNTSTVPYKQIKAKIVEKSIELVSDGVLIISKKQGKFKAHIYAGNFFLFDKIGSKKLNELDFTALNHGVNLENFVGSFSNTEGYIYALADFGKLDVNEIEINYQVPSIYTHTLWELIFNEAGVEYYGDIFETDKFKSKLTTMHRGYNSEIDVITNPINITAASETESATFTVQYQGNGSYLLTTEASIVFFYPSQNNVESNGNARGAQIQPVDTGNYNYDFDLDITIGDGNLQFDAYFVIQEIGSNSFLKNQFIQYLDSEDNISINLQGNVVLEAGKEYVFFIRYLYNYPNGTSAPIQNDIIQTISDFSLQNSQNLTSLIFQNFIGDMSQIDFVKDVMQEFGLISKKRRNQLAYDFIQVKTLLSDRSNTLDWSEKLKGQSSEYYKLSSYAQSNRFAYNYLESVNNRFADGILKIDNENLPSEKTLVTRPYNAPENSTSVLGSSILLSIPFWKIKLNDDGSVKGYKPFQSKNYIGEIKYINTTINYKLTNGESVPYTGEVPILDFSQLSYGQILNENYSQLKSTLDFNHIKTLDMLLNELDIQNLDLFKTIFLKQYSSDFYINKITYQDSSMKSKVELVKIKRSASQFVFLSPTITLNSIAIAPNSNAFNYNWSIKNDYIINNISNGNATITATQITSDTGGSLQVLTSNIEVSSGTKYFVLPLNLEEKAGDYEIQIEKDGVFSNVVTVNIG